MERKIVRTGDGSTTIQLVEWNEQYHSMHGAVQEARHVFLKMGFDFFLEKHPEASQLDILEIGFGTGLNALLTLIHAENKQLVISYEGVEAYPVSMEEIEQLNYLEAIEAKNYEDVFNSMHQTDWEVAATITKKFQLKKRQQIFETITDKDQHNLIYFDAFGARVQPELWGESIFEKMYAALKANGVLVTYAAKGSVRRAMQAVGFAVERLPGPPGKREMLRATKAN
ncbi:tRNA U34 5-methylaminomethyl-2-thiouridine-forming methyltransferase MnmC [Leeuwenhoekiella aestuarii]|uniref:tRNA U34 5-methylaminomethyl-2-thiouridine-forming methyltransferase MnmC n=1 Tax=Leeuwenhoekiella aestuarii TaxID=2249426 RepID=A0A4Q0NSB1_9FLAO|nr:tRNA (5-methylaminomethyl-2-thiouridine)(34)-methyltransferase MnmD [Leeuwenhoekiella aestuarii]RXG12356.1 tRNA U34 5-methylaminomethyl-2-thiouridine-forming methyltransferase MnmC [Leeuwenhoekiella aestuarii]RXG13788.1 tRNA U34 5-methylaminomethyl-2-thiouridine-forming methyltransferase MnmC [Leeuwenhoekiella aestuarii]